MKDEEFDKRLRDIATLAKKQRERAYRAQSDAMLALSCIETLALLLVENYEAKHGVNLEREKDNIRKATTL